MIRFLLQLTKETHERLRQLAFKKKTSMSEEVRRAIDEYLREGDKE